MTIDVQREKELRTAEAKGYASGSIAAAGYEHALKDARRTLAAVLLTTGPVLVDERTLMLADMADVYESAETQTRQRRLSATMPASYELTGGTT